MPLGLPKKSSTSRCTEAGAEAATNIWTLPFFPRAFTWALAWLWRAATRASTASTSASNAVASGGGALRTSTRGGQPASKSRNNGQRRLFMGSEKHVTSVRLKDLRAE